MYTSLEEIHSVTLENRSWKKRTKTKKKERKNDTAVKHKPFGIAMPGGIKNCQTGGREMTITVQTWNCSTHRHTWGTIKRKMETRHDTELASDNNVYASRPQSSNNSSIPDLICKMITRFSSNNVIYILYSHTREAFILVCNIITTQNYQPLKPYRIRRHTYYTC